jgi:hypothetical protein
MVPEPQLGFFPRGNSYSGFSNGASVFGQSAPRVVNKSVWIFAWTFVSPAGPLIAR